MSCAIIARVYETSGLSYESQRRCARSNESVLRDLWDFLRERKKFWLLPIVLVMLLLGGLLVFTKGSVLAPLLYPLF